MKFKTANDAWEHWYKTLNDIGDQNGSLSDSVYSEVIGALTVIEDPTRNIVTSEIRNLSMRYAIGELLWYLSGSNRLDDIAQFSAFWNKISDDGATVNSAYGQRIFARFGFDQFEHCRKLLANDLLSRQAVIHIKEPSNVDTKDLPCTMDLQFLLRDNKLNCITHMRSNDIWLGFPYDVFCFTSLQILMAFKLGVEIGEYMHFVGSLHLYYKDRLVSKF